MDDYTPTILVVDDNYQLATTITQVFQLKGYKTLLASSKDELFNVVMQAAIIDVVLLDLRMPDISGEEALVYLRSQPHLETTPIIIFSAISDVAKRVELINKGADDYIVKPSPTDDLLSRVTIQVKLNQLKAQKKEAELRFARQQQYSQAIAKIGLEATSYIDLPRMVKHVTQSIVEAFRNSKRCSIYIVSSEDETLQLVGIYPPASADAFVIPEVVQRVRQTHNHVVFELETAVPIIHNDSLLGVMTVETNSVQISQELNPALTTLTVQLATVIANIRLFEDIQTRNNRLEKLVAENQRLLIHEKQQRQQAESLYYMAQIISSRLDEDEVLTAAMDTIQALFVVETASVRLLDGRTQHFTFSSTLQDDVIIEQHINQPKELGIIEYVVNSRKPLILNHVSSHPHFRPSVDAPSHSSPHTMLCTPLIARDTVIGAIQLINKESGMFTKEDLDLLNVLASSIGVAIDNSHLYQQQVELTEKLKLSQNQLIQSEKMGATGRLAASLAHEINNPLQAIDSCLQLTIDFDLDKEKQDHYLGMAREEVERLSGLVTRIMDFARPASTERKLVFVNDLMRQVLQLAQKHISNHNWDIQAKLADNLPPISAIPDQISQVFLGIILNAFDAIGDDGIIRIVTKQDGKWIKTIVKDNGCGISPDIIEHIFESFLTTKTSTAGLGLTIGYHIVNQHGGMIEVKSRENVGSVFTVSLPVADMADKTASG